MTSPKPKPPYVPDLKHTLPLPQGFDWCAECGAMQPTGHRCNDPIDNMTSDELLALVRVMRVSASGGKR